MFKYKRVAVGGIYFFKAVCCSIAYLFSCFKWSLLQEHEHCFLSRMKSKVVVLEPARLRAPIRGESILRSLYEFSAHSLVLWRRPRGSPVRGTYCAGKHCGVCSSGVRGHHDINSHVWFQPTASPTPFSDATAHATVVGTVDARSHNRHACNWTQSAFSSRSRSILKYRRLDFCCGAYGLRVARQRWEFWLTVTLASPLVVDSLRQRLSEGALYVVASSGFVADTSIPNLSEFACLSFTCALVWLLGAHPLFYGRTCLPATECCGTALDRCFLTVQSLLLREVTAEACQEDVVSVMNLRTSLLCVVLL